MNVSHACITQGAWTGQGTIPARSTMEEEHMDTTVLSFKVKLKEREDADTLLDAVQIMSLIANHPGVEVVTLKRETNKKYPSFDG